MAGPRLGRIVVDHHALWREANELLVLAEHGRDIDRVMSGTLVDRLSRLCERLEAHFALEESGGYLRDVVVRRPGLQARVTCLQREHAAFLSEGAMLSRALLGSPPPRDATIRLVRLLEALRRHEVNEHDLIQQAFLDEFGSGD